MGISIWQLLIILAIVVLIFGAKRLRTLGGDLGASVKGFREAMKDGEKTDSEDAATTNTNAEPGAQARVIEPNDSVLDGEAVKDSNSDKTKA